MSLSAMTSTGLKLLKYDLHICFMFRLHILSMHCRLPTTKINHIKSIWSESAHTELCCLEYMCQSTSCLLVPVVRNRALRPIKPCARAALLHGLVHYTLISVCTRCVCRMRTSLCLVALIFTRSRSDATQQKPRPMNTRGNFARALI